MLHVKLVCTEWKYNLTRGHWNFVLIIVKDYKPIPAELCLVLCFWLRIDFFTEMFYVATDVSTFLSLHIWVLHLCTCTQSVHVTSVAVDIHSRLATIATPGIFYRYVPSDKFIIGKVNNGFILEICVLC